MVAEHSCVQIVANVKFPQENSNKLPIKSQSTAQKQARDCASLKKP